MIIYSTFGVCAMLQKVLKTLIIIVAIMLVFLGVVGVIAVAIPNEEPIDAINGGDPFIVEDGGNTYYTYTTGGGVDIVKIESFDNATEIERKTVIWAGENNIAGAIWAPEIHKIGDRWYIIACAGFQKDSVEIGKMPFAKEFNDHDDYYRYSFVLESNTEDIFGDYTFKGILAPDGLNNIDGTYLQKGNKLYYVCSAYRDVANQAVYICEMENPYTLKMDENGKNNAIQLSEPEYSWEKQGWLVNEGPAVLYNGDNVFVLYSASGFSSGDYCMGMLTLTGDDIMNTENWKKESKSVYNHDFFKGIYNPGHCSFLYRENGEIFMVYHANKTKNFEKSPRLTYIKQVEFKDGKPVF